MLYLVIALSWVLFNTWFFLILTQIDDSFISSWDELFTLAFFSILGIPAFIVVLGIQKLQKVYKYAHYKAVVVCPDGQERYCNSEELDKYIEMGYSTPRDKYDELMRKYADDKQVISLRYLPKDYWGKLENLKKTLDKNKKL